MQYIVVAGVAESCVTPWDPTNCSLLAWKIPWTEEPGGLQSMGLQSDTTEHAHTQFLIRCDLCSR